MILKPTPENIGLVASHLRMGGITAIPTETVYGLAADALDAEACALVFEAKERPTFDPLIVHISAPGGSTFSALENSGLVELSLLTPSALASVQALAAKFWPGPLTLVLPKTSLVPDLVTSGLPSVAIRFPAHPVAQEVLRECGRPLAAPSANRFGRISPTQAEHVETELGDRVKYILDGGPCEVGLESTVLRVDASGRLELLRPGKIAASEIEAATGSSVEVATAQLDSGPQAAPGMLASHYAPAKKLLRLPVQVHRLSEGQIAYVQKLGLRGTLGLLVICGDAHAAQESLSRSIGLPVRALTLSHSGDLAEAAQKLFATLRTLDADPELTTLLCEPGPEGPGLAHAIRDRLNRASTVMPSDRKQDPLHGITLEKLLMYLVERCGWEELGDQIPINCFISNPSIKSSLTFLRRTPWARKKVEDLYLDLTWRK